ncbi:MAG: autotransporter outer membrane beta-barrel domain-containing protein, partial [Sphingomonas sp.]
MIGTMTSARRVRVRALQTSGMALAMLAGAPAFAQCAPDPTQANATTTCTGTVTSGLKVTTYGTIVLVPAGATVQGGGQAGIAVALPSTISGSAVNVTVGGRVDGGAQPGISLLWQAPATGYGYTSANLALTVAQGGSVTGSNAVVVGQSGPGYGYAYATIDNSGTLTGTSGVALLSTAPGYAVFSSITNRATGSIGAISAPVRTLTNAGTIDGGTRSAVDWGNGAVSYATVSNSGTITAASSAATLANLRTSDALSNSGLIRNSGTGAAISGDTLSIANAATGRITTAGTTAIGATTYLNLTNAGTITGNVVIATSSNYTGGSTIDSRAGTINGAVTFGAGNDTLVAGWNGSRLVTGITGVIDGGAGTDTVRLRLTSDTTLSAAIPLPTNFEQLSLAPDARTTATLADGFAVPGILAVNGSGTVINRTGLSGTAQAVLVGSDYSSSDYSTFVNAGSIRTTAGVTGIAAIAIGSYTIRFENSGTITATGDGVSSSTQGSFVNTASGTITATGTAVSLFGPSFTNAGTIRSTGGTGVVLSGSSGSNWTNSGRIEGATAGARISSTLVNTGTISSTGTGVLVDYYGVLDNRAGGTIDGGVAGASTSLFNATIANAGTINGNVRLTGSSSNGSYNANRFFALAGGVVNGDLTLGGSDMLVAELAGSSGGRIAGITGTVTGANSLLRYRVRADTTTTLAMPSGFAGIGYDLYDGVTLTLTGAATQSPAAVYVAPLSLAGRGTVDLDAVIAASSQPAIQVTSLAIAPGETTPTTQGLTITSRGALTLDHPNADSYPYAAVALGSNDSFTNAGTITVRDRSSTIYSRIAAIAGGKSVTNSGTITLDAATGVSGANSVTNTGSILQATSGAPATGVINATILTNSGTIDVAGNAVQIGYLSTKITNSGRLASSATAAIGLSDYSSYGTSVTNLAGGTIVGGSGQAIQLAGGTIDNAGTITGSVDLGYASGGGRAYASAVYIARGGTIAGDLRFGRSDDLFVAMEDIAGVSGTIDGGDGNDTYIHARSTSGSVAIGALTAINFEHEGVRALGADTVVTIGAAAPIADYLRISGDGAIVNGATLTGAVLTGTDYYIQDPTYSDARLTAFTNTGTIGGGFSGTVGRFINTGTLGSETLTGPALSLYATPSFVNSGTITNGPARSTVSLSGYEATTIANSGTITGGGLYASLQAYQPYYPYYPYTPVDTGSPPAPLTLAMTNSGTITGYDYGVVLSAHTRAKDGIATVLFDNSGTVEASAQGGHAVTLNAYGDLSNQQAVTLTNSGTIRANAGGVAVAADAIFGGSIPAVAVRYATGTTDTARITNASGGVIEATGTLSTAILGRGALDLDNAGTIRGGAGTTLASSDSLAIYLGAPYLAGAIQTLGNADNRIVNTGTITGSIALGGGNDRIENRGRLEGDVFLGAGNDTFLQLASATLIGTVDGGAGIDSLIVDATGGGTVNADQFVNFESLSQIGQGNVSYLGSFKFDTIGVSGGTVTVAAGQTLATSGPIALTGTEAGETVVNNGTIVGSVALGGGNDEFVEGAGSRVTGIVDGGSGDDLYTVALAGDRSGIGARTGFERLGVTGTGTLRLTLDQDFTSLALTGTSIDLTLAGHGVGSASGSDAAETLRVDGDIAAVTLGGGDDTLALGTTRASGRYDGGAGNDTLAFTNAAPVTLAGIATGFEQVSLTGGALTVTGTLGTAGAPLAFGAGDQQLTVGNGSGTLALAGTYAFDRVSGSGNLAVLAGSTLTAGQIQFGGDDNRLTIAGRFAGSVDGGAGRDTIVLSGGSEAAPVAFGSVANVEALTMTGGFATVSGTAAFGAVDMSGGRLVGLSGSTLSATQFLVRQGATFGSAGTVNGNVTVAGILSPGASPGTMTVNGNVAIQSGSLSLFEITPTVSDKLVVNGQVAIAPGATLQLAPSGTLRPGTSYDLITASGGITGSYTTILKPDSLFGFVVQRGDRIQLLGQFLDNAAFAPQVSRSIAYANTALVAQGSSSALIAALPSLLTANGTSNPTAFARITPEAYASASQIGVDNALALSATARGPGFATGGDEVHPYTFAQMLGGWHRL